MRFFFAIVILSGVIQAALLAHAQAPMGQPTISADVQNIENQLGDVGCRAERQTAAQTIVALQGQIADLKKQLKDPPKSQSGATRH
jgi:hypothetical protein